jgi:hypothetical protein
LFYDQKGEAYPDLVDLNLNNQIIITNPFDSRCSAWDMAKDIRTDGDAKEVAAVMVPPIEGTNKYFFDAAALMLTKAIQALIKIRKQDWTFRDVILACSNVADLKALCEKAELSEIDPLDDFLDKSRESKSVGMTLTVENSKYSVIAAAWEAATKEGRTFSLKEWVGEGKEGRILLIGYSDDYPTALATVDRLLIRKAQQLLLSYKAGNAKTGRRTWMFLDEFPSLGPIAHLDRFLTEGRSRGVCAVIGFQHIDQIKMHYKDNANVLLGQCLHQAYFRVNDAEMGRWCASQFGRLISYNDDGHMKNNDPSATENTFIFELEPATEEDGFQCVIRSARKVVSGPRRIEVPPRKDLEAPSPDKMKAGEEGFSPWKEEPVLKPWDKDEREKLGLLKDQPKAPGVPLPEVALSSLTF